jgi:hypothetical protein
MQFSQVKQQLNFKHEDMGRIPDLCDRIRMEIAASCPKVVTDGSKTFQVKWLDFGKDSIEVIVDCRLKTPPIGEAYYDARQGILEAIARAVKASGVEFAKKK